MFGANGLGLPAGMIAGLGTALPGLLHVPFLAAPMHLLSGKAFLVLALFPVVWFLPNTQEILGQAKGEHSDITGFAKIALWRPNLAWATSLGVAMIAVLWYMTDTSSFLYFQF